jgi:hypothetical protein
MTQDDQGTTRDGDSGQTRELMPDADSVVPKPSPEVQMAPERLAEIEAASKRKMEMMQQEYWRLRNEKQPYMRCPYCDALNFEDNPLCCGLFTKAFRAILERQAQVDVAAQMVRNCAKVGLVN